jgi:hypothetical protein
LASVVGDGVSTASALQVRPTDRLAPWNTLSAGLLGSETVNSNARRRSVARPPNVSRPMAASRPS